MMTKDPNECLHMHVRGIQTEHGMWMQCKDCGKDHVWEETNE